MKIRDRSTLNLFDSRHSNADRAPLTLWLDPDEPDADNFAGGGGARLGLKQAFEDLGIQRRAQGVAVNHWPAALAMYAANHPECRVICENIVKVRPHIASGGKRYAIAWFSPTCIYFSQAKGGKLEDEEATKVRGLAWMMVSWAASPARPRVMCMENVKPFMNWGPLHRHHDHGCSKDVAHANGTRHKNGKFKPKCLKACNYLRPIKARIGSLFRAFVKKLRRYYRYVEWRVLKACDYGDPTSRERFFLIASDEPVAWPEPTHGPGRANPYRTAAECIDFSNLGPSIFDRVDAQGNPDPLAEKTLARIKAGAWKFVLGNAKPFIVHLTHGARAHDIDVPTPTVTGANRGELGLIAPHVVRYNGQRGGEARGQRLDEPISTLDGANRFAVLTPYMVHRSNGERREVVKDDGTVIKGQDPRVYDTQKPIGTLVAGGIKHGLVAPVLVKGYSQRRENDALAGRVDEPIGTITQRDHNWIAAMYLAKLRGTSDAHVEASAHSMREPTPTVSAGGTHLAAVAAYLVRFNGQSAAESLTKPISTIDTRDRFALVTMEMEREVSERALRVAKFLGLDAPIVLEIDSEQWVLVDIGFRMLTPRELFLCQGFPPDWKIDIEFNGKPLTKTAQIKCVGNSVPPGLARAVAKAAIATVRYEDGWRRAA